MDKDSNSKFDLCKKKSLHNIYYENSVGSKLRSLRLKNNVILKDLSNLIKINETTLRQLEKDRIIKPYYYWKIYCEHFSVNHVDYLGLCTMKEKTIQDKLLKIRAYTGAKNWGEVGQYLGYSEGFILDLLHRYTPNSHHIKRISAFLNDLN